MGMKPRKLHLKKQSSAVGWIPKSERSIKAMAHEAALPNPLEFSDLAVVEDSERQIFEEGTRLRRVRVTVTVEVEEVDDQS